MGLDMFLYKTVKVEGASLEDYNQYYNKAHFKTKEEILTSDIPDVMKKYIKLAVPDIKRCEDTMTVFEEVGYWRKFNALHAFFVDNFQDGIDECQLSKPIDKEGMEKILEAVKEDNLTPRSGFFFGSTEKDGCYDEQRQNTIKLLEKLLSETDFNKEVFFYKSSW